MIPLTTAVLVLSLWLAIDQAAFAQPFAAGAEFQVNIYTTNEQESPAVAAL